MNTQKISKMKNIFYQSIIAGIVIVISAGTAKAGGDDENPPSQSVSTPEAVSSGHVLDKGFYFLVGASNPMSDFTSRKSGVSTARDSYGGKAYGTGLRLEAGTMFNLVDLSPSTALMLRVGWFGVDAHRYKEDIAAGPIVVEVERLLATVNVLKVAPQISFTPAENFAIDAYFGVSYTAAIGSDGYFRGLNDQGQARTSDFGFSGFKGITYQPGISLRYSVLMTGFEMNWGNVEGTYKVPDAEDVTRSERYPLYRFYVGLKLNKR